MELVKRVKLLYQADNSDKVYEVDLCRLGQESYVVNFRYGRRGSNLREGTKTIEPVNLVSGDRIFNKLVNSKVKKGYQEVNDYFVDKAVQPTVEKTKKVATPTSNDARHQAILRRLANRNDYKWSLERIIWRAGELKIKEAAPLLLQLLSTGKPLRDYCIIWSLGWCGDKSVIAALKQLSRHKSLPDFVQRITWEAIFKLSDSSAKLKMQQQKINQLPSGLKTLATEGTIDAFTKALRTYLDTSDYRHFEILYTLYQIDNEYVRPALLKVLADAPLKPNYFKQLRYIFKMAEYRQDAEVFGLLAYLFETNSGNFNNLRVRQYYSRPHGKYIKEKQYLYTEELKSPRSSKAYSQQTREYLRRRVWRTLGKLGEEGDSNYISMAMAVLLQYTDADAKPVKELNKTKYNYRQNRHETVYRAWDGYANYLSFNHILYENSPRYESHPHAWRYREGYKPDDGEPEVREEAFPQLWQRHPAALLQLLLWSNCEPVHHFAVKALRDCGDFCENLETKNLIRLVVKPYEVTASFAFEFIRDRYNNDEPNLDLVLALSSCILPKVRNQAYEWIEQKREHFLASTKFIARLIISEQTDTRVFAKRLLSLSILNDQAAKALITEIIAHLLTLSVEQNVIASEIGETLLISFTPQLRTLELNRILELLNHPMAEIQTIGARILLNHQTPAVELPIDLIESLISSSFESVRGIGMRIFGQLPDETLISDHILIMAMAVNSQQDLRQAIRPIIRRLTTNHPEFGVELALDLIDLLTTPERHERVHKDLVTLLQEDISGWMNLVNKDQILELMSSKSAIAQELGGVVLQENCSRLASDFRSKELVKLANHEILAIRKAGRKIFSSKLETIRNDEEEILSAVHWLESKWDDSREFAWRVFGEFTADDWTPKVMVTICDSVREDVRRFGRDLVTRYFKADFGHEYLMKFSEHPSSDMQTFATNYLTTYAADNPQRLTELISYFVSVLSQVNRGKVAKQRIFKFLETEALKEESAAMTVGEILTRQSVTVAIGDKAKAIQIMLKIRKKYPNINLPIQVKEVEQLTFSRR